ncbi:multidrug effflux MFS transporter [Sphingomonas piscis]|uniref:Bcr/CflA family efflux transporter n=1 Tax=Sphingomonas piscis TaxID=2714943 RepID=A0A6G7YM44_9SPHN|nr:Bcr/CflA family efflux MFS transporter [Sphingomonas piscis]QIK77813.1 multidrug effflux MFS transporter [Sphingomonas piscis]
MRRRTISYSPPLLLFLAAAGALGSMAIHMVVPAFPLMARDWGSTPTAIQSALTFYLLGIGLGQLVSGPASDVLGRRPVMLAGTIMFAFGSAASAAAPGVQLLVAARVVQALGGAAAIVAARTIVSDLSSPDRVAGRVATLTTVVLISPAVSPVIGGLLASSFGWRAIFLLLAVLGTVAALLVWRTLGESRGGEPVHMSSVLPAYGRLLRNRRFRRFCLIGAAASSSLYIFLSSSPFLLSSQYGLAPAEAGLCYFLIACSAIAGTLLVRLLERRGHGLRSGAGVILAGGILMMLSFLAGLQSLAALLGPMMLVACGGGIAVPAAVSGAMHAEEGLAGTGSSLAGALQMSVTALITTIAAQAEMATLWGMPLGVLAASLIAFLAVPGGPLVPASGRS